MIYVAPLIVILLIFVVCIYVIERDKRKNTPLKIENLISLDSESLAEGAIVSTYDDCILPILSTFIPDPDEISEDLDIDAETYVVFSPDQSYTIYSPDTNEDLDSWDVATHAIFDIVNRQLVGTPYNFYAFYGGNDLSGKFMTDAEYEEAIATAPKPSFRPYIPTLTPPRFGLPKD